MKTAAFLLAILLGVTSAHARMVQSISLRTNAAAISVESCFDNIGMPGFAPLDITIRNQTGDTRQWVLEFSSPGYTFNNSNSIVSTFAITVENNSTRTTPILVPMIYQGAYSGIPPITLRVSGYGAEDSGEESFGADRSSGKSATPWIGISNSLGTSLWSSLQSKLDSQGKDLKGSLFDPAGLPADWRGLSGVAGLWMTGDELNHLSPAQRDAIRTWVRAGGWLWLYRTPHVPPEFSFAGFGQVFAFSGALEQSEVITAISTLPGFDRRYDIGVLPDPGDLAEVRPNVPVLIGLMGLFSVVVGPVNFFAFARRRRERLFWTTPLISLCASGVLMTLIVFKDGTGGHGVRGAVITLFPDTHTEIVNQRQLSRSGLLLGSGFDIKDPVCVDQLEITGFDAMRQQGRKLRMEGGSFGGEWFATRAAQEQGIIAVKPTRAEITVMNADDVRTKAAAPIIVSSFDATLDKLYYVDSMRRTWKATDVHTGRRETLVQAGTGEFLNMTPFAGNSVSEYAKTSGIFWATASSSADYVPTLGAIHWNDGAATYIGPVTNPF